MPQSLGPLDEYPVHQVPQPIAWPGSSDRNFYDRSYFNAHDRTGEIFVISGIVATRSVGNELARVTLDRAGASAASAIRLLCFIGGYAAVGLALMSLLRVDLSSLLIGGAVTAVVVGIAAQQTLANFFAGLVLLFVRPYVAGERIRIRTGAMGGPFEGVILAAGLMYTTIHTDEGPVSMPNSGLLAAAIGPAPDPATAVPKPSEPSVTDGPNGSRPAQ